MHSSMPPLTSLRAFEAAARHLSLTKAAQELNVTAGAHTPATARMTSSNIVRASLRRKSCENS